MEISSLIKAVTAAKGLSQKELAESLGITLDRVKSITSGKVRKLKPEELKGLVERWHVRGQYLATGEPPIFMSPGEIELERRMAAVRQSTKLATQVSDEEMRRKVQNDAFFALIDQLTPEEQQLIAHYRRCSKSDQQAIDSLVARFATNG
ncbi:MAG: helix-turn-helix transcriptional regulator [Stenotrophomonas sp.]